MNLSETLLKDKCVLITGASSGIGRECSITCSCLGARVILMGRDEVRLGDTLKTLCGSGHQSLACDLTDIYSISAKLALLNPKPQISGFIHCAGFERTRPLKGFDYDDFEIMFKTNVVSAIEISKIISSPRYIDKSSASYVFISSVSGINSEKGKLEYSITKSSLITLSKTLALELANKGIRVNCVSPAMVNTPMFRGIADILAEESVRTIETKHLFGIIEPRDIANMCVYLISELGSRITGANFVIDSGYTLT